MGQIVHFGLGNFARAHLLDYTADAIGGWTVIGVNLRSSTTRDGLAAQDYAYALKVQGVGVKQIAVINTILLASEGQQPILETMATADIISATVTEKGYHLDQHGQLDLQDPVIAADLTGLPLRSLIGFIAHDLAQRDRPVTILSCDNRPGNGDALSLSTRQGFTPLAHQHVKPLRVGVDQFQNTRDVGRFKHISVIGQRRPQGDVLAQRAIKQHHILLHIANMASQLRRV